MWLTTRYETRFLSRRLNVIVSLNTTRCSSHLLSPCPDRVAGWFQVRPLVVFSGLQTWLIARYTGRPTKKRHCVLHQGPYSLAGWSHTRSFNFFFRSQTWLIARYFGRFLDERLRRVIVVSLKTVFSALLLLGHFNEQMTHL